ncbi:MAG: Alpha/beta hydrolase [Betaproteobacteria bacterium]|nr:Alpha/beta hydrolase [Betaproteobacteria bacterium]
MTYVKKTVLMAVLAASAMLATAADKPAATKRSPFVTTDHFVPYRSSVEANSGQLVGIHVRQKVARANQKSARIVLFVHGATVPGVPDFDLDYKDYNWMAYLARAGFNTYAMDNTGYGGSPKPRMDDPCNVDPKQQDIITPRPLQAACKANYARQLNTIRDDWQEIDAVVDYLRRTHGVKRIDIIGWSAGGPRVGGYIAQYPQKIGRAVLYAPSPTIADLQIPERSAAGFPVSLQTRDDFENKRWDPDVRCPGQVEAGVRDAVWSSIMTWDTVGASWGPPEGVMRGRTATSFGWTPALAARVVTPTLVMVGEFDRLAERRTVYDQLGSKDKVFLNVSCASHFMVWEKQHLALHSASLDWLMNGRLKNVRRGDFQVDPAGKFNLLAEETPAKSKARQ